MDIIQHNLLVKTKRKWKSRWVVLRRVNPASARINLYIYKDRLSAISKHKEKFFLSLREFCGMENIDKENKSPKLVIITASQPLSLRFESKADRDHWVDTIVTEGNFGEDVSFDGIVPSKHPLRSGEVTLHIYPDFFTLVRKQNSRCLGRWNFEQLFNYGSVEGGFVFRIENDAEKGAEPESFFLLTSWEKQINRTFDTVYRTARHMYGSAEGLQRPTKLNSPTGPRPRSMSEPSSFKRFMHRLSFRRKSRRPKNSKLKTSNFNRRSDGEDGNPTTPDEGNLSEDGDRKGISENVTAGRLEDKLSSKSLSDDEHRAGGTSTGATSALCFESVPSGSLLVDVRHDSSNDACEGAEYVDKNTERKKANGVGASNPDGTGQSPSSVANTASNNIETERGRDSGSNATKKSNDMTESLFDRDSETLIQQQQLGSEYDVTIWQRKSALFLNTDDMIQQGFIKSIPPSPRRSSTGDSPAEGYEGNNNSSSDDAAVSREPGKGTAIQARRNTSSLGGKRPMLTIEITPSGSEPSLNQYVNVPVPETFKSKQVHKLKQGEWDKYDSEENVYHHLAAVVGPLEYQNVPGEAKSRSVNSLNNSYQNFPGPSVGHSYENVAGGRGNMHYINVEAKAKTKPQQSVNYIKVSGSGPPTPIQKNSNNSFVPRKPNSDYAEIDTLKTQRLREMAKETKERVKKS